MDDLLLRSAQDLIEDIEQLRELATQGRARVLALRSTLTAHPEFFRSSSRDLLLTTSEMVLTRYGACLAALDTIHTACQDVSRVETWQGLRSQKVEIADELRTLCGISAGVLSSGDWQSPSFAHSQVSQAGRRTGKVMGCVNDYTRDRHFDGERYENAFARTFIQAPFGVRVCAFATSSGMAAVTTASATIRKNIGENAIVLAGKRSYFQNKYVYREIFGDRLQWVDETDTASLLASVRAKAPRAIFLDTLCNTGEMPLLDVAKLIPALADAARTPTYLVLDNSTRSIMCQPYMHLPRFENKLSIVVVESLNKFHQYGFDRVTAGVIQAPTALAGELSLMRMNLGTNIPVASVLALPQPNRAMLERRIARIGRNTESLARALEVHLAGKKRAPFHVVHPRSPDGFSGGFFVLAAAPGKDRVAVYSALITRMVTRAKKRGVDLIAGTSFGFDVTRVYVTARYAGQDAEPFVRISPGAETMMEIEALQKVMIDALDGV